MTREQIETILAHKALPGSPRQVKLIETHISWVLLTPRFAYKIKKPINYSFLDFSTMERRKYYCQRELELNRRLTEDIYLQLLEVHCQNDRCRIDGPGELVDHTLQMKRLDNDRQMDRMLVREEVGEKHMRQLARQLADFHRGAEVIEPGIDPEELHRKFADLSAQRDFIADQLGDEAAALVDSAVAYSDSFLRARSDRIFERNREGMVIDGHGDLHSKNIFLLDQPVIFDCIEFNDDFRHLDLL
ncbi:MAG: hypothetical protein R3350_03890, partial [Saprospiraceae bacterium]|nr:hypothetical protein [Saprospiraceae bacterium]